MATSSCYWSKSSRSLFLRFRTLSVSRYSIWPLMDRKSSSAHRANSSHSDDDRRSNTCFLAFSFASMRHPSYSNKSNRCLRSVGHHGCHTRQPADCSPWLPCVPHQAQPRCYGSAVPEPFPPYLQPPQQFFVERQ